MRDGFMVYGVQGKEKESTFPGILAHQANRTDIQRSRFSRDRGCASVLYFDQQMKTR